MNVPKKVIIATTMQHVTILMAHSTAPVILALQEMEHIAKVTLIYQERSYHLFVGVEGGGGFGEFALPNFIIPCEVIGVRVKKIFGEGRAFVGPKKGVAATVVGGMLPQENFEI